MNLVIARKNKIDEGEWKREEGEQKVDKDLENPSIASSQEDRIDTRLRRMERMMERLLVHGIPPPRENQE